MSKMPKTMEKFTSWMQENCVELDGLGKIDIEAEFGKDLSFNEAVGLAIQKSPLYGNPNQFTVTKVNRNR